MMRRGWKKRKEEVEKRSKQDKRIQEKGKGGSRAVKKVEGIKGERKYKGGIEGGK